MSDRPADVIDHLVGIEAGSRLDRIRAARQQARDNAQASYAALFAPAEPGDMTLAERFAVAAFVAGLHRADREAAFYRQGLVGAPGGAALAEAVEAEAVRGRAEGPAGRYPDGPLSRENTEGPRSELSTEGRARLGPRLAAALAHAHYLVFRPRDAEPEALQALLDAGWTTTGIVTLSQTVAFLAFQIRVVAGLRVLAALPEAEASQAVVQG